MEHIKIVNGNKYTANLVGGQEINGNSVLSLKNHLQYLK